MSSLVKEYIRPVKVISQSNNIDNIKCIFENDYEQVFLTDSNNFHVKGNGYIILDFGKEICGGIRVLTSYIEGKKASYRIRIRFGESLMECSANINENNATNDHSIRDAIITIPELSDMEFGQTGFRFVRIDFLDKETEYCFKNIVGVSHLRDIPVIGTFESDDKLLNSIFNTCSRTIHLCMQNMLWDGIKRDRLVWIGDMQPEVLSSLYVFGATDVVEKSIIESEKKYPLPNWFGAIPTYNAWYIQIICDYYRLTGKKQFTQDRINYINGILTQFDDAISSDGHIDYARSKPAIQRGYFIDWPSSESNNLQEGNRCLLIYVLTNAIKTLNDLGINVELINKIITKLKAKKDFKLLKEKQLCAFQVLSNEINNKDAFNNLISNGAHGLSTFMSYYIASAIAKFDVTSATEVIKEYYGGMLSLGATSFFEDFDIDWLKNAARIDEFASDGKIDVHGKYGKYCYKGYRHSLCHGWSAGPIQFIMENIVGIHIIKNGFKEISINPQLGKLKYFNATIPTPYGIIKISYKDGKIIKDIPTQIKII